MTSRSQDYKLEVANCDLKMEGKMNDLIPSEVQIENQILEIRGFKVIVDTDLAILYEVETKRLNEQVKRNLDRFPKDFMFQLTDEEFSILRSQFATSSWGGRRYPPYVFTEHGALMAASVLNSPRAVEMSVYIVRAFVKLRSLYYQHKELAGKVAELELKLTDHDHVLADIIEALNQLLSLPVPEDRKPVGFKPEKS